MLSYKCKRERPFSSFWILIGEEPVIAPPTARYIIFCSCPLTLLLFRSYASPSLLTTCTKSAIVYVIILYLLRS